MFVKPQPPYLGVAYYPEDWSAEEIDRDIEKMKEIGINTVRIAEFAWHLMEPRPGEFHFEFFHEVVRKMSEAGIAVVMGTPSATPPMWFARMYPDALVEESSGRRKSHGGRRHCCSNNVHYNRYSLRIAEKMAQEFGDDPAVIGWQIDNEIYAFEGGCFCPECRRKFQERLRRKFGTIDALNRAWNLNLFSQWYDDFSDIPAPRDAWHNPHLRMEWENFQNDSHIEFVHRQAEVLRRYVKVPIGTDSMPFNGMDYHKMTEKLDVVQFNHYNEPEDLYRCTHWFDYLRTLREHPFWNTETATCWSGATEIYQSIRPDGFCKVNSWLPVALGAEANMYWLWRTHWAGHELMHGSVLDSSGREMHIVDEVKEVAEGFRKASEFLNGTRVKAEIGLHFSSYAHNMHGAQTVVAEWDYSETVQDCWYRPIIDAGLRPDVIDGAKPLDAYRLIFTPMLMSLDEYDLETRVVEWVKNGGTWVVGPLTDVRTAEGTRFRDGYFGMLEELTGIRWCYNAPDRKGNIHAQWADGTPFNGNTWFEMTEDCGEDTQVRVTAGHRAIIGKGLLTCRRVGKGTVVLLGTVPSAEDMNRILKMTCAMSGIHLPEVRGELIVVPRVGEAGKGLILVDLGGKGGEYTLDHPMTDLLTGRTAEGKISLNPYDVMVLK